jgi:hypothetical protein
MEGESGGLGQHPGGKIIKAWEEIKHRERYF